MPHFQVEYSKNIEGELNVPELLDVLTEAAVATGVFPLAGVRARASVREHFRVADGHPDNGFIHINLRIGAGRPVDTRKEAGQAVFDAVAGYLKPLIDSRPMNVSLEISEIHPDLNFKVTNLRDHMAARESQEAAQ